MKDWELHLALSDADDEIHDVIEAQLARQDELEHRRRDAGGPEPHPGSALQEGRP